MKVTGFIQRFIKSVGLDGGMSKGKFTHSENKPLIKNYNGEPMSGMFIYSSVLGMLPYLSGHTYQYDSLSVKRCARYMLSPKILPQIYIEEIGTLLEADKVSWFSIEP